MKRKNAEQSNLPGMVVVVAIGIIELLDVFLLYRNIQNGVVISVRSSSGQPIAFLLQCLREFLIPAVLLIGFAFAFKRDFCQKMYMTIRGKWQKVVAIILAAVILGFTIYGLVAKADKVAIVLSLFYYLVIVAFAEEFVMRDACTYFLRNTSWPVRYLLPNFFFALLHLFSYAKWGEISNGVLLDFISKGMLGYILGGCMFQLLKEKSGSIWLPVLLHCVMDYSVIFLY